MSSAVVSVLQDKLRSVPFCSGIKGLKGVIARPMIQGRQGLEGWHALLSAGSQPGVGVRPWDTPVSLTPKCCMQGRGAGDAGAL